MRKMETPRTTPPEPSAWGRGSCLTQGAEGCWALEPGRRAGTCWTMTKETSPPGGARRDEPLSWPIVSWGHKVNLAQRSLRGLGKEGVLSCSWSGSQGKQSLPLFHPCLVRNPGTEIWHKVKVALSVVPLERAEQS